MTALRVLAGLVCWIVVTVLFATMPASGPVGAAVAGVLFVTGLVLLTEPR